MKTRELNIKCLSEDELSFELFSDESIDKGLDIKSIKYFDLCQKENRKDILIFLCDSNKILRKYIRKLIKYKKFLAKNFLVLNIVLIGYDEENSVHTQIKRLIRAVFSNNRTLINKEVFKNVCTSFIDDKQLDITTSQMFSLYCLLNWVQIRIFQKMSIKQQRKFLMKMLYI